MVRRRRQILQNLEGWGVIQTLKVCKEVCEKWCLTSDRSVDVLVGKKVIGVNSW